MGQAGGGFWKSYIGAVHDRREPSIGAPRESVGFVQKCFRSECFGRQQRRSTGETAHAEDGLGWVFSEKFSGGRKRAAETARKRESASPYKADCRQGKHFHSRKGADRVLVHFFGRDEQGHRASALDQLLGHRKA